MFLSFTPNSQNARTYVIYFYSSKLSIFYSRQKVREQSVWMSIVQGVKV